MDYSELIFGHIWEDLNVDHIEDYFKTQRDETQFIEFKSFSPLEEIEKSFSNLKRAICAFLNSEGGILVWGAPKENRKNNPYTGDLTPNKEKYVVDWLVSKISDSIIPLPIGIRIKPLELKNQNGWIYIFQIQKSFSKPHQSNGDYWIRLDGKTVKAPHYFIEAMFKQISFPDLCGFIHIGKDVVYRDSIRSQITITLKIKVTLFNFSEIQNEQLFSYKISTSEKIWIEFHPGSSSRLEFNSEILPVFRFGEPISRIFSLTFNKNEFFSAKIRLTFGGKYSPSKISEYELRLENMDQLLNDSKSCFNLINENMFLFENQKKMNQTKEAQINEIDNFDF